MKSNDLRYIYNRMPYTEMNVYPQGLNTNTVLQFAETMKDCGYRYSLRKLKSGHHAIEMLRKNGDRSATLKNPIYPTNSQVGRKIAIDKFKTEKFLRSAGLGTTKSKLYESHQLDQAKKEAYAESSEGVVIKPLDMSLGKGVFTKVAEEDFGYYWEKCTDIIKETNRKEYRILVQEFMEGYEVRATVLEGHLISIVARVPAFVIGDGNSTIETLIDQKNEQRKNCGYLSKNQIKKSDAVRSFLKHSGYDFNSIPRDGEYVLLISVSNTSLGGEVIEITNLVSNEIKELALDALAALPGMYCGGIDIMVRDFDDTEPKVIEINPFPVLSLTMFPTYGLPARPTEYFLNAFYTKDQILNEVANPYDIKNSMEYITNYMEFHHRQEKLHLKQRENSI
ncbi:ATP-grasp domain-containing protein [Salinicoccus roseus]|uniref:ATP-grasp domain-containing protein n=2 Tax=Salinicoccus roseus TaxID=45670 RepID=UPI000F4EB8FF|nr:ATP-grasp domain-containing protein [Salinicoccus roseus]RPE54811.1 cyanophycin synthetase [Salinicoccus roseus]